LSTYQPFLCCGFGFGFGLFMRVSTVANICICQRSSAISWCWMDFGKKKNGMEGKGGDLGFGSFASLFILL
jgi:hypothetical protein